MLLVRVVALIMFGGMVYSAVELVFGDGMYAFVVRLLGALVLLWAGITVMKDAFFDKDDSK